MKTLVERIRKRELAIENDGSLEELRKVVKHVFPEDKVLASIDWKYYFTYEVNNDKWYCSNTTDIPLTVSVKELLAEIEGEGKETKVIYLNEEDKPNIEEPLSLKDFIRQKQKGSIETNYSNTFIKINGFSNLDKLGYEWLEYRNNFKPNDKPIELKKVFGTKNTGWLHNNSLKPSEMDLIIVVDKETFIGIKTKDEYAQWRFKGNLNNGKVN